MATSSRFAVSAHVLTVLALEDHPVPSTLLARSASTSAVVIRQLLQRLKAAELIDTQLGKGGGAYLARPAAEISLADVYDAVECHTLFETHRCAPAEKCKVGRNVLSVLRTVTTRAEAAMRAELSGTTIADMATRILECCAKAKAAEAEATGGTEATPPCSESWRPW